MPAAPPRAGIALATPRSNFQPHDVRGIRAGQHGRSRNLVIAAGLPGVGGPDPRLIVPLRTRPERDIDRTFTIRVEIPLQMVRVQHPRTARDRSREQAGHVVGINTAFHRVSLVHCNQVSATRRLRRNAQMPEAREPVNPQGIDRTSGLRPAVGSRARNALLVREANKEHGQMEG